MKKSAIIAFVLISSTFFALTPVSAPSSSVEKPVWNVGDSWSMGNSVDLSAYEQEIQSLLAEMGEDYSASISGGIGYYQTIEVVDDDTDVGEETCYKLSFKAAFGANIEGDMSMSMNDEYMGEMSMDMWISAVIDIWIDGHIYFTVDELAFKKIDLVITAEIMVEGDMSVNYGGQQESGTILVEGKNIEINFALTFTPALDIFDFPIESGESWGVPDAETEQELVVDSSGTLKLKMSSGGQTMQETLDLSDPEYQIEQTTSIAMDTIEITAGKVESKYELGVDASGFEMGGMDMIPIGDLGLPSIPEGGPSDITLTYDPEAGFVEGAGVGMGEGMEFALEPASKSDVDTFYADPSANVPGVGLDLLMILLIVAVIVAVVAVVAAVLVRRKRKKAAPGHPPGYQPSQGPITGQQYPQPPGYQAPLPPPDQPYTPPPPPPPPPQP